MDATFALTPVAVVRSQRAAPEDDAWGDVESVVELAPGVPPESLDGIEGFSHVEVVFVFDRVPPDTICRGAVR